MHAFTCTPRDGSFTLILDADGYDHGNKANNSPLECLDSGGRYTSKIKNPTGNIWDAAWYGSLANAKSKCNANRECKFLHDIDADGANWRACKSVTFHSSGSAATMTRSGEHRIETQATFKNRDTPTVVTITCLATGTHSVHCTSARTATYTAGTHSSTLALVGTLARITWHKLRQNKSCPR